MFFCFRKLGLATVGMVLLPPFTRESFRITLPHINFHHSWLFELTLLIPKASLVGWLYCNITLLPSFGSAIDLKVKPFKSI